MHFSALTNETFVQGLTLTSTLELSHEQAILDQNNLTKLAGGVREGQNIAQNGPRFWLWSPLEAPKWVKDPRNGLKSIRGSWGDHLGSISGVLDPFRGLQGALEGSRGL